MSHTLECEIEFRDEGAIRATCREIGLPEPERGKFTLHQAGEHEGIAVRLPGWRLPVVIDTRTGVAKYDNYGGKWGDSKHLDRFSQLYAANKVEIEARKKGWHTVRQKNPNGSLRVQITRI